MGSNIQLNHRNVSNVVRVSLHSWTFESSGAVSRLNLWGEGGHSWDSPEQRMLRQTVGHKLLMGVTINMHQRKGEQPGWAERRQTWKAGAVRYCPGSGGMLGPCSLAWLNPWVQVTPEGVTSVRAALCSWSPPSSSCQLEANLSVRHYLTVLPDHNCFWSPVFIGVDKMAQINNQ